MKILMSNSNIYNLMQELQSNFNSSKDFYLPTVINFAIQKNLVALTEVGKIIESVRNDIGVKYGTYEKDDQGGHFFIPEENRSEAEAELKKLMELEQIVEIRKIHLSDLSNVQLTTQQMQALLFMIEEE